MISYIVLSLVITAFLLACYEDIKKREVYDYLNFSFAFIILIIALFDSMISGSFDPIKYSLFGTIIGFALGAILFYGGIWGGGDAKFLLGFSASVYYIKDFFLRTYSDIGFMYDYLIVKLNVGFNLFLDTFLLYITYLDLLFLMFVLIQFLIVKRRSEKINLLFLFTTLSLLFVGLYFNLTPISLVVICFTVFIMIFFAKEGVFDSVYLKYKKHLTHLEVDDKIDDDIRINSKVIVKYEDGNLGLSKEQINNIKDKLTKDEGKIDYWIRKSLPFSILILLNFVTYLIKIITINPTNLEILSFMFRYLFYSFIAGGFLAVFVVIYYFIKNVTKIKHKMIPSKFELLGLTLVIIVVLLLLYITGKGLLLFLMAPLYIFVKMAIAIETVAFVGNKKLSQVTLGDWIVQDIEDEKGNIIYEQSDFKIGVDEFQLEKIKKLSKTNQELKQIKVKDGIAFLPALFAGFIIMYFIK
jgi:hypothetical protein